MVCCRKQIYFLFTNFLGSVLCRYKMSNKIISNTGAIARAARLEGGLRMMGAPKYAQTGRPLVTIITASFNAAQHLPRTIKSIRELSYENIEWIIVDGNSTDGTVNLIRHNEDVIDYWVSEPDNGIYDAWNKGISVARGEWIAFLGAGDSYRPHSISAYLSAINASPEVPGLACSQVQFVNDEGLALRVWGSPFKWNIFKRYMNIAHVGALHHKSLFEKNGLFDKSYSSSSDYEFFMRYGERLRSLYLETITADMLVGGISNGYNSIFETYLIQKKYGAGVSAKLRYWLACVKRFIRPVIRDY